MKVIIHIGAPKTATSSLQSALKSHYPRFRLYDPRLQQKNDNLLTIFIDYSKGHYVDNRITEFFQRIINERRNEGLTGIPEIISSEYFFEGRTNLVPEFPHFLLRDNLSCRTPLLASFLEKISDMLVGTIEIFCLFGIREPAEWLCSKYAQSSAARLSSSQKDFEKLLAEYLSLENNYWISFSAWRYALEDAIGQEKVYTLDMSDISCKRKFTSTFTDLNIESLTIIDKIFTDLALGANKNQRGVGINQWALKKFHFEAWVEAYWRARHRKNMPKVLRRPIGGLGFILDPLLRFSVLSRKPNDLYLSENIRNLILEYNRIPLTHPTL